MSAEDVRAILKLIRLGISSVIAGLLSFVLSGTVWMYISADELIDENCISFIVPCSPILGYVILTGYLLLPVALLSFIGGLVIGIRKGIRGAILLSILIGILISSGYYIWFALAL
jgi:hypothetical protein